MTWKDTQKNMGTKQTLEGKMDFMKFHLKKSADKEKGMKKAELAAKMMIAHNCTRVKANEVIQCFIDAGFAQQIGDEIYGL